MDISQLFYFLLASIVLTLVPGPDILFVIAQSITQGKRAGLATALGLCSGVTVHTLAAAIGISAILYQSTVAFQLLKYAGAVYLLYLAWQAFRENPQAFTPMATSKQQLLALFRKGVLMNILNPKVSLFFLMFLPQFVTPSAGHIAGQMIILGLIFMIQAILIFALVSLLSGSFGERLFRNPKIARSLHIGKGLLFALIGLRLAFSEK